MESLSSERRHHIFLQINANGKHAASVFKVESRGSFSV